LTAVWEQRCGTCGETWPVPAAVWRCSCGGLLELDGPPATTIVGDVGRWSMWRYEPVLPPLRGWEKVTLGEGMTPVVTLGEGVRVKVDFLNPTLSFKDRGAALLVTAAVALAADRVVADSSGNAGTAVAAYAARAGLEAEVWVPAGTSPGKLAAMRAHGADVRIADGDRAAAAVAAAARVEETGAYYASHVYQPLFAHGVKTLFLELWEQLGGRLPATLVLAAGNGTLVSGCAHAVADLRAAGLIAESPRMVAVQAEACAPLAGLAPTGPTVAEGIAIAAPPRRDQVIAAVAASGGSIVTVADEQILAARIDLAEQGLWVEPTAAAPWAAWHAGTAGTQPGEDTVVVLCGAGLKYPGPPAAGA
jgi:threonine synthase